MITNVLKPILVSALVFAYSGIGVAPAAAADDYESHAGYVEIDWSESLGDREPSVQVFLERPLLRMMAAVVENADGGDLDIAEFVRDLSIVRVEVYEDIDEKNVDVLEASADEVAELKKKGWRTVVRVPEEDETVNVLMKTEGENIAGFVILVAESDELVFINIAGAIDPEKIGAKLGALGGKITGGDVNLDQLQNLLGSLGQRKRSGGKNKDKPKETEKRGSKKKRSKSKRDD